MAELVPPDEEVAGAFVALTGPRPGVEAFSVLAFGAGLVLTSSYVIAAFISAAVFVAVTATRKKWVITVTEREVLVIDNPARRGHTSGSSIRRLPRAALPLPSDSGDGPCVRLGDTKYWVWGANQDEAWRLRAVDGLADHLPCLLPNCLVETER